MFKFALPYFETEVSSKLAIKLCRNSSCCQHRCTTVQFRLIALINFRDNPVYRSCRSIPGTKPRKKFVLTIKSSPVSRQPQCYRRYPLDSVDIRTSSSDDFILFSRSCQPATNFITFAARISIPVSSRTVSGFGSLCRGSKPFWNNQDGSGTDNATLNYSLARGRFIDYRI